MRSPLLFVILAGVAWGQINPPASGQIGQKIEPDAEKLYHRAATALQQLPTYEMDVETTLSRGRTANPASASTSWRPSRSASPTRS